MATEWLDVGAARGVAEGKCPPSSFPLLGSLVRQGEGHGWGKCGFHTSRQLPNCPL